MTRTDGGPVTQPRFQALVETAPSALLVVDERGRCTWWNRAWEDLTGVEAAGDGWLDALLVEDRDRIATFVHRNVEFETELRIAQRDGTHRDMLMRATLHCAADGTFIAYVIAVSDVTQRGQHTRLLQFLASLGEVLSNSLELEDTLKTVAGLVVPGLADLCVIAVADDSGRIRRVAVAQDGDHVDEKFVERDSMIDPDSGGAIAHVMRTGTTLYRPIVDAPGPDEPWPVPPVLRDDHRMRSLVCAPLRSARGIVGALAVVSWQRPYTPEDVELMQEIAHRCAVTVDNAVLYRRSEEARAHLALVAQIGAELAATLDIDESMASVARGVVPTLADEAQVWLARGNAVELCAQAPPRVFRGRGPAPPSVTRAFGSRHPILVSDSLCVPLMGVREVHGVLALAYTTSGRRYSATDLPLALDIARRAGVAVDRARAFDQERRIAETLQRSLLPDELPDIEGVTCCARYLPGGEIDVGGDWYDVVALGEQRFGVVIGDVAGHGVRAAATMAQIRHALRAFAADGDAAGEVLTRLNRFIFAQGPVDMATLCYGVLDVATATLEYASAGHLPLLVLHPDHRVEVTSSAHAPPIGIDADVVYAGQTIALEPGTTVVFYTDGLVERRGESLDRGFERLADEARFASPNLDEMCDELLASLVDRDRPHDDVALLGVRFLGTRAPMYLRRPARAAELAPMRRVLSAWLEAASVPASDIPDVAVAVTEAATNAIEHAYVNGPGWFEVAADVSGGVLTVRVRDMGRWRPKARGAGGRGLGLIARLMDRFEVRRSDGGTEVWMQHDLAGHKSPV